MMSNHRMELSIKENLQNNELPDLRIKDFMNNTYTCSLDLTQAMYPE